MADQGDEMSWGSLLAGLAVGAVVGATVALLYAPQPGRATRKAVLARLDALRGQVDDTARSLREQAAARLAAARADLGDALEAGVAAARARADALKEQAGLG